MRLAVDIPAALAGERILITGATGFLGKVLVEKLLFSAPRLGRLVVLIRPTADRSAAQRLRAEILDSPIMARLKARHGSAWSGWAAERVEAVEGDLTRERFGLSPERYAELCARTDRVISAAATVRFDERLDRALAINVGGALSALGLARAAAATALVQVSTCFVSGLRRGEVAERIEPPVAADGVEADIDPEAMWRELAEECERLHADPAADDAAWVAAGRTAAARYGFADVYTLTKALAERLLERRRGAVPTAVVRPAIVESAFAEPIPGWIEAVRVADPLLVAYGRGRIREIPGAPEQRLELIPVDLVVNALIAVVAAAPAGEDEIAVFQVGSRRNPVSLGDLLQATREGLRRRPFRDEEGRAIRVDPPRFVDPPRLTRRLVRRTLRLRRLLPWASRLAGRGRVRRLESAIRGLDHFRRLIEIYHPYLTHGARYDDSRTRALWRRLTPASRADFAFDVTAIDWPSYLAETHLPGIVRFALKDEEPPPPAPPPGRAERRHELIEAERRVVNAATLFELFASTGEAAPDAIALQTCRDGRWLRYSYRQAQTAIEILSSHLARAHGVSRGDRVALWSVGSPEWTLTCLALHRLGAVAVPLDPQWPSEEIGSAVRWVGARLVLAAPALAPKLAGSGLEVAELASPLVPEPDAGEPACAPPVAVGRRGDLAAIVFTSGTTVKPRAVPLTHGNFLANVADLVPLMDLCRERLLSVLPIHHVFELTVGHWVPLAGASTISYVAEVKPAEISWMMRATRPTVLVAVPRLLQLLDRGIQARVASRGRLFEGFFGALLALSRTSGGRLGGALFGSVRRSFGGSLRRIVTGGSALDADLGRRFAWMGFEVAEGYGLTETAPVLTVNPWGAVRFGSAGRPLPGVELKVEEGEVRVRGDNVMSGYLDDPAATAEVLRDGWLATGDLGRLDADGYLHLSGRAKEVIVTAAGKNVHPEEVEHRYRDLPGVEELAVVGLPAASGGEQVAAVVVPAAGAGEAVIEAIHAALAERAAAIPTYQRVSRIEIWRGDLPKTTTLKVRRGRLREALLAGRRGEEAAPPPARPPQPAAAAAGPESEVLAALARLTRTRVELLRPSSRLSELGVDSLTRVELVGEIESRFGVAVDDAVAARLDRVADLLELLPAGAAS